MRTWTTLLKILQAQNKATLLYVVDSKGSSPGRKGFAMIVDASGNFTGTIGGGIMEVKLLEFAKNKMRKNDTSVTIKQQFHNKQHSNNQSGLICSGEQTIAIIPFHKKGIPFVESIIEKARYGVHINVYEDKLVPANESLPTPLAVLEIFEDKRIHIFGGGHVGLALSKIMSQLDYHVMMYDDRENLSTIQQNNFANEIKIIDFHDIETTTELLTTDTVVIVTTSYRTDKLILKQLINKKLHYLGMMGSEHKIQQLWTELATDGISQQQLAHVHAPIGSQIYSKTTMEIAVSIAGQIILEKNKGMPTGRSY